MVIHSHYSLLIHHHILVSNTCTIIVALVHGPSGTVDTGFHGLGTLRDEHGMVVTKKGVLQQGRWKVNRITTSCIGVE